MISAPAVIGLNPIGVTKINNLNTKELDSYLALFLCTKNSNKGLMQPFLISL
jgi:hypothetical protein